MDYLRELTDRFGGRLTGSTAYQRPAEWVAEQFKAAGIKNVKLEPVDHAEWAGSRMGAWTHYQPPGSTYPYRIARLGAFDTPGRRQG